MALPARIVDAHHHLWALGEVDYPWLMTRGARRFFGDPAPIQRDYRTADFRADWDGLPVVMSVHVQVGAADALAETRWLAATAAAEGLPSAIVAFADLTAPDLDAMLEAHAAAACGRLRGVRQIVSRHPSEDGPAPGALLADPRFVEGLTLLAERGLSFDLQLSAPLLPRAAETIARVQGLRVALCHAGSPWHQSPVGLAAWRQGLEAVAALPNVSAKLSGLGMFDPGWSRDSLAPVVEGVLDAFGAERTMWGSNFPVDRLYRGYRKLLETVAELVPAAMHETVFASTAERFYRI